MTLRLAFVWAMALAAQNDASPPPTAPPQSATTSDTPAPQSPPTQIGPPTAAKSPSDEPATASNTPSTEDEAERWALDAIELVKVAMRKTRNVQCVFYKEEWKNGADLEPARGVLKHRRDGSTFLAFESGPQAGRHILWRPGKNDDNLLVSNPMVNLNLERTSFLAMRNNRHTIDDAGLLAVGRRMLRDASKVVRFGNNAVSYTHLGRRTIEGERSRCFGSTFDKKKYPSFFAARTEICVSEQSGLPMEIKVW